MLIGKGILTWDGKERRTDRYGSIVLDNTNYDGNVNVEPSLDMNTVADLDGKKVKLTAVIVESRESGHIGDMFHGIFPSMPDVGERIEIGVGILGSESVVFGAEGTALTLEPNDGRPTWWIDPHVLYRLHDQTIELYAEETEEDAVPFDTMVTTEEPIAEVLEGGVVQVKGTDDLAEYNIQPKIENLGDGLFSVTQPNVGSHKLHANGRRMFNDDGMMLDENGNRSIFCDVDAE